MSSTLGGSAAASKSWNQLCSRLGSYPFRARLGLARFKLRDEAAAATATLVLQRSSLSSPSSRQYRHAVRLCCSSGDGLSQEADEAWSSIVESLQDADTIAMLYNMPGADDIPIEMIERFREGSRRPEFRQSLQDIFEQRGLQASDATAQLADPAFLRDISIDVQQGLQLALETSQPETAQPQASHPSESQPSQAAVDAALSNSALRAALFELLPPHMHDPDIVRAAMQTPSDLAKLQGLLLSQKDSMSADLQRTLLGSDARLQNGIASPPATNETTSAESSPDIQDMVADKLLNELMNSDELWQGLEPLLPKSEIPDRETFREMVQDPVFRGQVVGLLENDPMMAGYLRSNALSSIAQDLQEDQLAEKPSPGEFAARINANERLTALLSQPHVQEALDKLAEDPAAIAEYQSDPAVMQVIKGLREIYSE
ncbi:hypothetical protein WJX74_005115 [Apatococcus lobatus]|uniref:STI1 domain-containing protein n=1 Tax=Apatococcus lobatus TaxID=904363 RepID=A0AAW1RN46_9CHLO